MAKALLAAALLGLASAASAQYNPLLAGIVKEKAPAFDSIASRGYTMMGKAEGDIEVVFAVRQNSAEIARVLAEVSDPALPTYGHYLTFEQVRGLKPPRAASRGEESRARPGRPHRGKRDSRRSRRPCRAHCCI